MLARAAKAYFLAFLGDGSRQDIFGEFLGDPEHPGGTAQKVPGEPAGLPTRTDSLRISKNPNRQSLVGEKT